MSAAEFDYARQLTGSALYAPPHYADVITAACALTHKIDETDSAPRILALGPQGSGKSTILKIAYRLAANACPPTGVKAMTAPSYVADFRMNPRCTHNIDEVNHLFGLAGSSGKSSQFYTYLNQGYLRDTAYAQYQENRVKMQIPIFGVAFMAGRGLAAPDDLRDRSIILKMETAPDKVEVADFSMPETRAAFEYGGRMLASWAQRQPKLDVSAVRGLHPKLTHRVMEVWGPLFAITMQSGQEDVDRLMTAFERIELDKGVPVYAPEDQLLLDYAEFATVVRADQGRQGVQSGAFAEFAFSQPHGAYAGMKPGQFKQFAVKILGPTQPFYLAENGKTVRGWCDTVHQMNLGHALARKDELENTGEASAGETNWEDF